MMLVKTLKSVRVPEEFVEAAGGAAAAARELTEVAVFELVRRHVISSGKAAELLGISRWDLPDLMTKHKVPAFELLPGETMEEHLTHGREVFKRIRGE